METFDVKLTCTGDPEDRLDIRLLVETVAEQPQVRVLMVKRNEIKNVTFDILNLHRYLKCISAMFNPVFKKSLRIEAT